MYCNLGKPNRRSAERTEEAKGRDTHLHRPTPILDLKLGAVLDVGHGVVVVVLAFGGAGLGAVLGGDPQVGRARVKNDLGGEGRKGGGGDGGVGK